MFARLTTLILAHRGAASLVLTVFVLGVSSGALNLTADFNVASFFGRSDPESTYLRDYLERWAEDDVLVVLVDGGREGLLSRERLLVLDQLADDIDAVDGVRKALSPTRLPRAGERVGGQFIPVPLLATAPRGPADSPEVVNWREGLLADDTLVPTFFSVDGRYASLLVTLSVDTGDMLAVRPVVQRVEEVVDSVDASDLVFHIAGVPAIRSHFLDVVVRDQVLLVPLSGSVIGFLLWALFRSRHGVLIPGVAASVPIAMLLGVMGWTGEPFSILNQGLLALVPAIAVADAIHLVSRFHEEGRKLAGPGVPLTAAQRDHAIVAAMSTMGAACFLTSFTTVVGFLSLLATDLPVLRSFGVYAAIGVALAYFTMLLIVPLTLLSTRMGAKRLRTDESGWLGVLLDRCAVLTISWPKAPLMGAAVVTLAALSAGRSVGFDTKVTHTFEEDYPVTQANMLAEKHLAGVLAVEVDLSGPAGAFHDPAVLAALGRVEASANAEDQVRAAISPAGILRTTSRLVGGPDSTPSSVAVSRQLLRMAGPDALAAFITDDGSRARLILRTVDDGAVEFLALADRIAATVKDELGGLGVSGHLTGSSWVAYRGLSMVVTDLRASLLGAFVVIGFIITILFRDPRLGALSLIPNMLPLVLTYGMMGALGWPLEPSSAMVYTIAVGVSVDSAIHVIARFVEERREGAVVDDAVRAAVLHSGRAVAITAVCLAVGFGVNVHSSSPDTSQFGRIGSIVVLAALASNLLVLPAMLKLGMAGKD